MVEGKSIQVDDGDFTRIHNAILEVLSKARLSGAEFRCIHSLLRKTYGWEKKEDRISLSQWAEGTDTKRPHVLETLNALVKKNIITRRIEGGQVPVYGFNKYIEQWQGIGVDSERGKRFIKEEVLPEQVTVPIQVTVTKAGNGSVTKAGNETVTNTGTHKRQKKIKENSDTAIIFPSSLDNDEFKTAWGEWTAYRVEAKHKLTPTTIKKQLADLSKVPVGVAIAMIDQSIKNGWRGLFPVKSNGARPYQPTGREHVKNLLLVITNPDKIEEVEGV